MSYARVLYRLVAYLQFIYGHVLLPEFSEILFPWNCGFLELASSMAGTKPFLCLMHCSEVVSLKQYSCPLEQSSFCADYGTKQERGLHCLSNTLILAWCISLYSNQGQDLILTTPSSKDEQVLAKPEGSLHLTIAGRNQGIDLVLDLKQRAFMACNNMVARKVNSFHPQDTCNY